MPKLTGTIPSQNFEVIRDAIAAILLTEFVGQTELRATIIPPIVDPKLDFITKIWLERFTPFDKTELPAINVYLSNGDYISKEYSGKVTAEYTYIIDVYSSAKTTADGSGDTLAAITLQKITGMCRAILENPQYRTLTLARGIIGRLGVSEFSISKFEPNGDAANTIMGRISFNVMAIETAELQSGVPMEIATTTMRLGVTDKGQYLEFA